MTPTFHTVRQAEPKIDPPHVAQSWNWRAVAKDDDLILESWSQGFVVGSLVLMACITIVNMRQGVLLHKLILLEQVMALTHGTFCLVDFDGSGWYLSSTAALLYMSYILHNIVAWMKVKPFFHGNPTIFKPRFVRWTTSIYTWSLASTIPPVLFQISGNFRFFNGYGGWYRDVRPYEALMRDPWWVFCCGVLFYVISKSYGMGVFVLIKQSPRFGILFVSIVLALIFTSLDIVASVRPFLDGTDGINPFWKLSLVFKCLTDSILLNDFKTELKRLHLDRVKRDETKRASQIWVLDADYRDNSDDRAVMYHSNGSIDTAKHAMNGRVYRSPLDNVDRKRHDHEQYAEVEFVEALQLGSDQLSTDRKCRRDNLKRYQVCSNGTPVTKLPRLFQAMKPREKNPNALESEMGEPSERDTKDL